MKQAVHIFIKDTRQQRYAIALVVALTVILLASSVRSALFQPSMAQADMMAMSLSGLSIFMLPAAWWFLVARVFHADAIPGTGQFWLTRPYNRASLLGAKAMFVLAYITLPMTLAQLAGVLSRGFPIGASIPGVLWSQLVILAVIVLPAAALAAATSRTTQFVLVALAVPLVVRVYGAAPWGALEWVRASVAVVILVVVTTAMLLMQFTRRRTHVSRVIAAAGVVAVVAALELAPWRTAFAMQSDMVDGWTGQLGAELVKDTSSEQHDFDNVGRFWFQLTGLEAGTPIQCNAAEATIELQNGVWHTGLRIGSAISTPSEGCWLSIPGTTIREAGTSPVNVRAVLYVTVFGPAQSTSLPIDERPVFIPGAGICSGSTYTIVSAGTSDTTDKKRAYVRCQSAFRDPRNLIELSSREGRDVRHGRVSYSPLPADLRIPPVDEVAYFDTSSVNTVTVATRAPIAHVRVPVDVEGVNLQDFLR